MSEAPYGSWPSPITSEVVVAASVRLGELHVDGEALVWSEERPDEGGRTQLVRRAADGTVTDLLPDGVNARTAVHEYGGGAWWVRDGVVWFTDWADQRLYRRDPDGRTTALTPEPATPRALRYADGDVSGDGVNVVCVRERHDGPSAREVVNEVVRLRADAPSEPEVLVSGPDFVASPRLSPDGRTLAWVQWNHPSMPWDDTELRVMDLTTGEQTVVAGGRGESVVEPRWSGDALWFLSDRTDWWNLYSWTPGADIVSVVRVEAEIGEPAWRFGSARYVRLGDGRVVFARHTAGFDGLAVRAADGVITDLDLPFSAFSALRDAGGGRVVFVAAGPDREAGVHRLDLGDVAGGTARGTAEGAALETLRAPRELGLDTAWFSIPEHVTFPSGERKAYALFHPPANPDHTAPEGTLPPLLVVIHGGPTASASPVLAMGIQYWTSRGFAVVAVDYGGSTGYGRAYREQLRGEWGVVDVADCIAAAAWLASTGRVDAARMCIRGGSAGGLTTLLALMGDSPFAAGGDHFGVADLAALAADTHKFESRYLDGLVGPYPQASDVYERRSPVTRVAELARPVIVLQGDEDAVVPPSQSEAIVAAVRSRGLRVEYLLFAGEQHGFRKAENIRAALDAEYGFYREVLGF